MTASGFLYILKTLSKKYTQGDIIMDIKEKLEQAAEIRKNQLMRDKERKEAHKQQKRTMVTKLVNDFLEENLPRAIELGLGSLNFEISPKDITSDLLDTLEPYSSSIGEPKGFIKDCVPEIYRPYLTGT